MKGPKFVPKRYLWQDDESAFAPEAAIAQHSDPELCLCIRHRGPIFSDFEDLPLVMRVSSRRLNRLKRSLARGRAWHRLRAHLAEIPSRSHGITNECFIAHVHLGQCRSQRLLQIRADESLLGLLVHLIEKRCDVAAAKAETSRRRELVDGGDDPRARLPARPK